MWKYKSTCTICGRETPACDALLDHLEKKRELGFVSVELKDITENLNYKLRTLQFCPACAKKSYTIDELRTVGNYNEWSY